MHNVNSLIDKRLTFEKGEGRFRVIQDNQVNQDSKERWTPTWTVDDQSNEVCDGPRPALKVTQENFEKELSFQSHYSSSSRDFHA